MSADELEELIMPSPEYRQEVEEQWIEVSRKYGINDAYVINVAQTDMVKQMLEGLDPIFVIKSSLGMIYDIFSKQEFDLFNGISPVYLIVGLLSYLTEEVDDGEDENEEISDEMEHRCLIATLTCFFAGTEGAADPKAMIERILSALPPDEILRQMVDKIEWQNNTKDHTQEFVESMLSQGMDPLITRH